MGKRTNPRLAPRRAAHPARTLREEFLNHVAPLESPEAAQQAVDGWVSAYNHQRPRQALDMATPASLFRPNGPTRLDAPPTKPPEPSTAAALTVAVIESAPAPPAEGGAVELEARVPPSGGLTIRSGRQTISLHEAMAGRTVTVWADLRTVHVLLRATRGEVEIVEVRASVEKYWNTYGTVLIWTSRFVG